MSAPTLTDCGCVARVHPDGSGIEIDYCDLHEAAPDLLAALQDMLATHTARNVCGLERLTQVHQAARAAIAKADPIAKAEDFTP